MSTDHINQELFGKAHALLLSAGRELAVWLSKCLPELDSDLTELYGIPVKVLNQAVKRNARRFPDDFMFQLTRQEFTDLRSQSVTSSSGWGGRRTPPYAFTEQGVAMLSSVLNSDRDRRSVV